MQKKLANDLGGDAEVPEEWRSLNRPPGQGLITS